MTKIESDKLRKQLDILMKQLKEDEKKLDLLQQEVMDYLARGEHVEELMFNKDRKFKKDSPPKKYLDKEEEINKAKKEIDYIRRELEIF